MICFTLLFYSFFGLIVRGLIFYFSFYMISLNVIIVAYCKNTDTKWCQGNVTIRHSEKQKREKIEKLHDKSVSFYFHKQMKSHNVTANVCTKFC